MIDQTVTPTETTDQRAEFVAGLREFADWLEERPWAPTVRHNGYVSPAGLQVDLFGDEGLAEVRAIADRLGMTVDEHLDDRASVRVHVGSVAYSVIAWRPTEEAADEATADPTGLLHSRADDAEAASTWAQDTSDAPTVTPDASVIAVPRIT